LQVASLIYQTYFSLSTHFLFFFIYFYADPSLIYLFASPFS